MVRRRRVGELHRSLTEVAAASASHGMAEDGWRRRRNSAGDFGADRRARASREHSGSTVVLLEAPQTSGDDQSVLLLTGAA